MSRIAADRVQTPLAHVSVRSQQFPALLQLHLPRMLVAVLRPSLQIEEDPLCALQMLVEIPQSG